MVGGHKFTALADGVAFRFKARARNGSNCCRIRLSPDDTYRVEFLSVRGTGVKTKGDFEGVYCDSLKTLFETETGLYLSL